MNRSILLSNTFGIPSVYIDGVVITYASYAAVTLRFQTSIKIVLKPMSI
jgi:hypothetical protein